MFVREFTFVQMLGIFAWACIWLFLISGFILFAKEASAAVEPVEAAAAPTSGPAEFKWVRGQVKAFTAQAGNYNVVLVEEAKAQKRRTAVTRIVRFCDPMTGEDLDLGPENIQYDLLKTAFLRSRPVNIGVRDFGQSAGGEPRLCIERVIF